MSTPPAGTSKKGFMSQDDYLAPPAIPTGRPPKDVLNTIWRKNDVYIDIGDYSVGSFVMVAWPIIVLFAVFTYFGFLRGNVLLIWWMVACFVAFPIVLFLFMLTRQVPPPVRFNRHRREVCVTQKDGSHWIVPWETVTAAATQVSSVSQAGKTTQGLLVVGFKNPDPEAKKGKIDWSMGFSCGGGTTAMALWECMRSYMEIGPEAVPDSRLNRNIYAETQIGSIVTSFRKKDYWDVLHGVVFITFFGTYFAEKVQNLKLSPPPTLTDPAIVEWSKPLPPEQWAKRSSELDAAIKQREAELAVIHAEEAAKEAAYKASIPKSTRPEKSNWPTQ